jgi:hypothetical protein
MFLKNKDDHTFEIISKIYGKEKVKKFNLKSKTYDKLLLRLKSGYFGISILFVC